MMRYSLLLIGAISVLAQSDCNTITSKGECHENSCIYDEGRSLRCYNPCEEHQVAKDAEKTVITSNSLNTTIDSETAECIELGCKYGLFGGENYNCRLPCSTVCKDEAALPVCACTNEYGNKCMAACAGFKLDEILEGTCDSTFITPAIAKICKDNNAYPNWYALDVRTQYESTVSNGLCPTYNDGVWCAKPALIRGCGSIASEGTLVCAKGRIQTFQFSNPCYAIGAGFTLKEKQCSEDNDCPHGPCQNNECFSEQGHYYTNGGCEEEGFIQAAFEAAMYTYGTSPKSEAIPLMAGSPFGFHVLYFNETDAAGNLQTEGLEEGCGCNQHIWAPVCLVTGTVSFTFPNECMALCRKENQHTQFSQVFWPDNAELYAGECTEPCLDLECEEGYVCASQGESLEGQLRKKCVPADQPACNDACFQVASEAVAGTGFVLCTSTYPNFVESDDPAIGDHCTSNFVANLRCPSGCKLAPSGDPAICHQSGGLVDDNTPCRATVSNAFDNVFTDLFSKEYGNDKVCVTQWLRKNLDYAFMRNKCQALECLGFYQEDVYDGPCDERCIALTCSNEDRETQACVYSNVTQERETVTLCEAKCRTDEFAAFYTGICAQDDCVRKCPLSSESQICIDGTISQNSVCEALCAGIEFNPEQVTAGLCDIEQTYDCAADSESCCDLLDTEQSVDDAGFKCSDYKQGSGALLYQFCASSVPSPNVVNLLKQEGYQLSDDVRIADVCQYSCSTCVQLPACSETNPGCCDLLSPTDVTSNNGLNTYVKSCESYKKSSNRQHCVKPESEADKFIANTDADTYAFRKFMEELGPLYKEHQYYQDNEESLLARHVCRESCGQCECDPLLPGCCDVVTGPETSFLVSEYGDCQSYADGHKNEGKCSEHLALFQYQNGDSSKTVADVCRVTCVSCRECTSAECCDIKEEFDVTLYGGCKAYAEGGPNYVYCNQDFLLLNGDGDPTTTLIEEVCKITCNPQCDNSVVDPCTDSPRFRSTHDQSTCAAYAPGGQHHGYCFQDSACGDDGCPCPVACLTDPKSASSLPTQCLLAEGDACGESTFDCAGANIWCYQGTCQSIELGACDDNPAWNKGHLGAGCDTYAEGKSNANYCIMDGACVHKENCPCPDACKEENGVLDVYPELDDLCAGDVVKCVDRTNFRSKWTKHPESGDELNCGAYSQDLFPVNFDYCTKDRVIKHGKCPITCQHPECVITLGEACPKEGAPLAVCGGDLQCSTETGKCYDPNVVPCVDNESFDAGFGGCDTYAKTAINHVHCSGDKADLQGACPVACGNTDCIFPNCDDNGCCDWLEGADRFNGDTRGCEAYVENNGNRQYCDQDKIQQEFLGELQEKYYMQTLSTDLFAQDVCQYSCGKC